jgi:hypothetical protein
MFGCEDSPLQKDEQREAGATGVEPAIVTSLNEIR